MFLHPEMPSYEDQIRWLSDWRYLNTDETMDVPELDTPVRGLALPKDAVEKIYRLNARRVFPGSWKD